MCGSQSPSPRGAGAALWPPPRQRCPPTEESSGRKQAGRSCRRASSGGELSTFSIRRETHKSELDVFVLGFGEKAFLALVLLLPLGPAIFGGQPIVSCPLNKASLLPHGPPPLSHDYSGVVMKMALLVVSPIILETRGAQSVPSLGHRGRILGLRSSVAISPGESQTTGGAWGRVVP